MENPEVKNQIAELNNKLDIILEEIELQKKTQKGNGRP
jgi:hypothetical protein